MKFKQFLKGSPLVSEKAGYPGLPQDGGFEDHWPKQPPDAFKNNLLNTRSLQVGCRWSDVRMPLVLEDFSKHSLVIAVRLANEGLLRGRKWTPPI
jgi:hypothetical protein